jgi:hypothetical protein
MKRKTKNHVAVYKLFKGRCILCNQSGAEVHEIVPRSKTKDWDKIENQVLLCREDHRKIHDSGAMNSVEMLTKARENKLKVYYG